MGGLEILGVILLGVPIVLLLYAYILYPLLLWLAARLRDGTALPDEFPDTWPQISVSLPAYNEEEAIGKTLEALLSADYPSDRIQVVVVSDASTDRTDEIVRGFADRGVGLVRLEERSGKTAAEAAAVPHLEGEIVVNTDASVRVRPRSLKRLVRTFEDPTVGVASGRDVSVADASVEATGGEAGYVDYEMWVRSLETRLGSIVGASGCFYAIRKPLHRTELPPQLSRDFAAALVAREHGYRAVSVDGAVCEVPRAVSLQAEFRRKVRTMERGLVTLWYKRHLLNPLRHGSFAWRLFSHKLCRWLVALLLPLVAPGFLLVGYVHGMLVPAAALLVSGILLATVFVRWPFENSPPRPIALAAFVAAALAAGQVAWWKAIRGEGQHIWEPTRRG